MSTANPSNDYSPIERFAADPADVDDACWFRAHWARKHRIRPPGQRELAAILVSPRPSPMHLSYVLVRQIADGRVRTFDWSIDYKPDNEKFCRRAFEDAWVKLSPHYPSPPAVSRREWRA